MKEYPTTIQVTPPLKPLYKVLDEQRTKFVWCVGKTGTGNKTALWVGGTRIAVMDEVPLIISLQDALN